VMVSCGSCAAVAEDADWWNTEMFDLPGSPRADADRRADVRLLVVLSRSRSA
jgi:hypothetical protein